MKKLLAAGISLLFLASCAQLAERANPYEPGGSRVADAVAFTYPGSPAEPRITWPALPGAKTYKVYYAADVSNKPASANVSPTTNTAVVPVTMSAAKHYFWIEGIDSSGAALTNERISFSTTPAWRVVGARGFSGSSGSNTSMDIAIGSEMIPYVVTINTFSKPVVQKLSGDTWVEVGSSPTAGTIHRGVSIAVDGTTPFISSGETTGNYCYKYQGGSWTSPGAPGNANIAQATAIAVFGGIPNIYLNAGANVLYYSYTAGSFNAGVNDTVSIATYPAISIAPVSSSEVYCAHVFTGNYANVSFWNGSTLATGTYNVGPITSLKVESVNVAYIGGKPHLAVQEQTSGKTTVFQWTGSTWSTVGSANEIDGERPSVASVSGKAVVAVSDNANSKKLSVYSYNGTSWTSIGKAVSTGSAFMPKLISDSNGVPYVIFADGSAGNKATVMRLEPK